MQVRQMDAAAEIWQALLRGLGKLLFTVNLKTFIKHSS
jgi:hypothetical protein